MDYEMHSGLVCKTLSNVIPRNSLASPVTDREEQPPLLLGMLELTHAFMPRGNQPALAHRWQPEQGGHGFRLESFRNSIRPVS